MQILPHKLLSIVNDIARCITAGLYYPAISVSLTLPDICAGLSIPLADTVKKRHYIEFLEQYSCSVELGLSAEECYNLRCGLIHRGDATAHPKIPSSNIIFTVPGRMKMHGFSISMPGPQSGTDLDIETFFNAMVAAVNCWYESSHDNETVIANVANLFSFRPDGVMPFVGFPVVASGP